jgi:hypothetical protein
MPTVVSLLCYGLQSGKARNPEAMKFFEKMYNAAVKHWTKNNGTCFQNLIEEVKSNRVQSMDAVLKTLTGLETHNTKDFGQRENTPN